MKVKQLGKYEEMRDGIRDVVQHLGVDRVKSAIGEHGTKQVLWRLWSLAWFDWQSDDSHPFYQEGRPRVLPFKSHGYINDFYRLGINDKHIDTALKSIAKELDLGG